MQWQFPYFLWIDLSVIHFYWHILSYLYLFQFCNLYKLCWVEECISSLFLSFEF
ncbi:hypothetical protein M6B38_128845 [Iris pallida]|uniref:ATP synthase F0 subunit 8 n=1 Tax=Iris pallida TaxID=29817 RepID=A0AAX6G6E8_IRIPA|nr:hypothetical protein M6B38_128845 [Iris pallida]